MGRTSRDKGRRGQSEAVRLLADRDWTVDPITSGIRREDLVGTCPNGITYSVEVKRQKSIDLVKFTRQAREQAAERRLPWLLMAHLHGTRSWLVMKKGERPVIWHETGGGLQ